MVRHITEKSLLFFASDDGSEEILLNAQGYDCSRCALISSIFLYRMEWLILPIKLSTPSCQENVFSFYLTHM